MQTFLCADPEPSDALSPMPPAPVRRKRRVWPWIAAALGGVALGPSFVLGVMVGSVGSAPSAADRLTTPAAQGSPAGATPEPAANPEDIKTVELTERGTLPMKPGASALASSPDHGQLASFTVHSVEVDPVCTGSYVREPENGHFVVMDVSVEVAPHSTLTDAGVHYDSVSTRVGGFRTVGPEGTVTQGNDIIGNGYGCLPEGSGIATDVRAGEKAEGTIIFDVPSAEGVIILPDLLGQNEGIQGWEWAYPAE